MTRVVLRWLVVLWRREPRALALIVALTFASTSFLVAQPWLWKLLIDGVTSGAPRSGLAGEMVAVGTAQAVAYAVLQGSRSWANARISWHLRRRLYRHVAELDPAFFRRWRSGDLLVRLSDDTGEKVSWFLCSGVFRAFEASTIALACFTAIAWTAPSLAWFAVAPLAVLLGLQGWAHRPLERASSSVQAAISSVGEEIATTFGGIRVVQAARLGPALGERFAAKVADQRAAELSLVWVQQGIQIVSGQAWPLALVGLLYAGGLQVMDGRITLGTYLAFDGWLAALVWPMFDVGVLFSRMPHAAVALARIEEILAEPSAPPGELAPEGREIAAHRLAVAPGLSQATLAVRAGERVAVTGEVGAGKTTLLEALVGLRPPASGAVSLGGVALDRVRRDVRARIGWVPQDPVLLSVSVRENVALGRDVDVERAVRVAQLDQDLPALPTGLDTAVGERGLALSGGQQQRVGIARALAGDPELLVLDDATSALDADTERELWAALEAEFPAVGWIAASHRRDTLVRADRVVFLADGRVADEGSHAELVARNEAYRALYG